MMIVDIGYFDVGEAFHIEDYYIQIGSKSVENYSGNTLMFDDNVGEKQTTASSFPIRKIDQTTAKRIADEQKLKREQKVEPVKVVEQPKPVETPKVQVKTEQKAELFWDGTKTNKSTNK